MNNRYYRKYIEKMIEQNPTTIEIERIKVIDDGFDGEIKEVVKLEPQIVRLYNKKSQREIVADKGVTIGFMASNTEKLLARHDADIKEGDVFKVDNREYKVLLPKNYMDICVQAELEVIRQ